MHSLVRRYLKTGIGFLALGLGLGLWMMAHRELRQRFRSPYLVSAHTHAIFVGFVMMMILGVPDCSRSPGSQSSSTRCGLGYAR